MKKIVLPITAFMFTFSLLHAEEAEKVTTDKLIREYGTVSPEMTWLLIAMFVLAIGTFALVLILYRKLKHFYYDALLTPEEAAARRNQATWLDLFRHGIVAQDTVVEGHVYDNNIQEYDNPPPVWFNWTFYLAIVFAAIYMVHYHVTKTGPLQMDEYAQQMKEAEVQLAKAQEKAIKLADAPRYTQEDKLTAGQTAFLANCTMCHGQEGEGGIGPNLTDEYWLHGGSYKDVFSTIFNGVPEKGMLAWKKTLKPDELRAVASYVYTLRNTKPAKGKEPQGNKYVESEKTAELMK